MKKLAVAGNPIAHSKSPEIFMQLCAASGIKADYTRLSVKRIEEIFYFAKCYGISGFNVTSPFKEDVYRLIDICDQPANDVKAVNVMINIKGVFTGYNTDVYGVTDTLKAQGVDPCGKKCVVAGSGGASRAAVCALKQLGADVYIGSRTDNKAEQISDEFKCGFLKFEHMKKNLKDSYLFIPAVTAIDPDLCSNFPGLIIFEANYKNPAFRNAPCSKYISGYEWLVNQASKSFELFFKKEAPQLKLKDIVKKSEDKRIIALIGPTLSGKTSTGEILAKLLNYEFYDSDAEIEKFCRKDISKIFQENGEDYFRQIEEKIIEEILCKNNAVLAIGAGAIQSESTRRVLKEKCFTILLDADTELAVSRSQKADIEKRPMLSGGCVYERTGDLFELRKDNYFSAANLIIRSEEPSAEKQAERIIRELNAG
ncbi:MAG TPA: shikimate kinase [Clostridiales bacterium]|nr:shikimate kinase [Clostridiales bacterium]HQP70215.1 shikimate kinase [Clostridiales bacterium]